MPLRVVLRQKNLSNNAFRYFISLLIFILFLIISSVILIVLLPLLGLTLAVIIIIILMTFCSILLYSIISNVYKQHLLRKKSNIKPIGHSRLGTDQTKSQRINRKPCSRAISSICNSRSHTWFPLLTRYCMATRARVIVSLYRNP